MQPRGGNGQEASDQRLRGNPETRIVAEFDVSPNQAEADARAFLTDLQANAILVPAG